MALGKMLNLGGIDNRPPKANQSMGRFRVARNVYPTPDGTIIPRYDYEQTTNFTDVDTVHHITQYDNSVLALCSKGSNYSLYKNGVLVPTTIVAGNAPKPSLGTNYGQVVTSYRINNTTYFQIPFNGALLKYDGVELRRAGCTQPDIASSDYAAAGTKFIKVVQHAIDFDNNEPDSELLTFRTNVAATLNVRTDGGGTNLIGQTGVTPTEVLGVVIGSESYFVGTAVYNAGTLDFSITTTSTNITTVDRIGSYVIVQARRVAAATSGASRDALGIALKVKSVSPLVLDATDAYISDLGRLWVLDTVTGAFAASITYGTKTFLTFWESTTENGVYFYRDMEPSFPSSTTAYNTTVPVTGLAVALTGSQDLLFPVGSALNEWYFVDNVKISPNNRFNFGGSPILGVYEVTPFYCMTNFSDLFLFANDNFIYHSDPNLPTSLEQLNASPLVIGDKEFGRITSICGTKDFLFVSRERKNYYVTGNITTGNYRTQEIIEAETGAWSNNCSIVIKDSVIFITALGVFQVVGGGKATKLSDTCPKNFSTYGINNVNEDVSFRLTGFNSALVPSIGSGSYVDDGIAIGYDEFRELLVFCLKGENRASNPCLVIHTKTGEFYEWDGVLTSPTVIESFAFFQANYIAGESKAVGINTANYFTENASLIRTYPITNPVKLYSTWLTAGEPSLEKELLQLKMFGRIKSNGTTSSIKVVSYKDWDRSTKTTNSEYFPNNTSLSLDNQVQYSHKKRLNSDKVLSVSVGIEVDTVSSDFEIESFEVEFNPIQSGMKK